MHEYFASEKERYKKLAVFFGLPFHLFSHEEAIQEAINALEGTRTQYFIHANIELCYDAYRYLELRNILFYADKIFCTSRLLCWIAQLIHRIPHSPFIQQDRFLQDLLKECQKRKLSLFLFGSSLENLKLQKKAIQKAFPQLNITGSYAKPEGGFFQWPNYEIIDKINTTKPHLLLLALGKGTEERWLFTFLKKLKVPLSLGVGEDFTSCIPYSATRTLLSLSSLKKFFYTIFRKNLDPIFFFLNQSIKEFFLTRKIAPSTIETLSHFKETYPSHLYQTIIWKDSVEYQTLHQIEKVTDFSKNIVCQCHQITFIDSSGLGLMAELARKAKKEGRIFSLLRPSQIVIKAIQAMHLERQIPILWTQAELDELLKKNEESLVLSRLSENGQGHVIKPLVDLQPKSLKKIEKEIQNLLPTLKEKKETIILNLEHIHFIDNLAISAILSFKQQAERQGTPFTLSHVNALPLKALQKLKLHDLLIEAIEPEIVD